MLRSVQLGLLSAGREDFRKISFRMSPFDMGKK